MSAVHALSLVYCCTVGDFSKHFPLRVSLCTSWAFSPSSQLCALRGCFHIALRVTHVFWEMCVIVLLHVAECMTPSITMLTNHMRMGFLKA